jgi:alpha-amylase
MVARIIGGGALLTATACGTVDASRGLSDPATGPTAEVGSAPARDASVPDAPAPDASVPTADANAVETSRDAEIDAAPSGGPRTVFVHLFEWRWPEVARECEEILGPAGYAAVQVSPPQEHALLPNRPWWDRYQPVSYRLISRGGDRDQFAAMVSRCKRAGVDVYVDAILNHMSFVGRGVGSGGTAFERTRYPGLYEPSDFHRCGRAIADWNSREEIQTCELATLPDLDTGRENVRERLAGYLQDLVDLGVAGIRVDAAKHISLVDLQAILGRVRGPLYAYHEVIDNDGKGAITSAEYTSIGDVTEFRYGADLSRVFRTGKLAWLSSFGEAWALLPTGSAIAFLDNHDNQRGHGSGDPLTHRERPIYDLAQVFMLAWPYGYPQIMSSYRFAGGDDGPPESPPRQADGSCGREWVCEHRWPHVRGMVAFRNATDGAPVTDWWTDGDQQIAFGRGARGFVIINRSDRVLERAFATSLPDGTYCDATRDGCVPIEVRTGTVRARVGSNEALAIHLLARARP